MLCLEECGIVLFCPKILSKAGKNCELVLILGNSTFFKTLCIFYRYYTALCGKVSSTVDSISTLDPQSLGPLGLNFLFFRQKESLTKKNTTQGGDPPLRIPPPLRLAEGSFSRRHGGDGGGGLKCKGAFAWRAWGGMEGEFFMEAGGSGVGGFRMEGLGWYGGEFFMEAGGLNAGGFRGGLEMNVKPAWECLY